MIKNLWKRLRCEHEWEKTQMVSFYVSSATSLHRSEEVEVWKCHCKKCGMEKKIKEIL